MITSIILKEERKKNCKKKLFLIFKIPIIYFLPIAKINNSSKISTYANFGHLMQSLDSLSYICNKIKIRRVFGSTNDLMNISFLKKVQTMWYQKKKLLIKKCIFMSHEHVEGLIETNANKKRIQKLHIPINFHNVARSFIY